MKFLKNLLHTDEKSATNFQWKTNMAGGWEDSPGFCRDQIRAFKPTTIATNYGRH